MYIFVRAADIIINLRSLLKLFPFYKYSSQKMLHHIVTQQRVTTIRLSSYHSVIERRYLESLQFLSLHPAN